MKGVFALSSHFLSFSLSSIGIQNFACGFKIQKNQIRVDKKCPLAPWGSLLLGVRTLDTPLGPLLLPAETIGAHVCYNGVLTYPKNKI